MNRAINDCSIAKEGAAIVHTYMNRNETATQGYHKKEKRDELLCGKWNLKWNARVW